MPPRLTASPSVLEQDDAPDKEQIRIGLTLLRLRQQRGLTLAKLAVQSGVAVGLLSEIERGVGNPSVRTLGRIRQVLGVPLSALFDDQSSNEASLSSVRRVDRRPTLEVDGGRVHKELLSPTGAKSLQFMVLTLTPAGGSGPDTLTCPGEKAGLVLSGHLTLDIEGVKIVVGEGDSFQFDSNRQHSFRNETSSEVKVIWIISQTLAFPVL